MAKLYFRYGAMGSSKSAQALITKFNYEEKDMQVWLMKPAVDTRDGEGVVKSRIGLEAPAYVVTADVDLFALFQKGEREKQFYDVIIADEAQFFQPEQIDQLRDIVDTYNVPVFCYGLRTDFRTKLFPGSARLLEIADSITELKTVCSCGSKAIVNARLDGEGHVITEGEQVMLGGNEAMNPCVINAGKKRWKRRRKHDAEMNSLIFCIWQNGSRQYPSFHHQSGSP